MHYGYNLWCSNYELIEKCDIVSMRVSSIIQNFVVILRGHAQLFILKDGFMICTLELQSAYLNYHLKYGDHNSVTHSL